MIYIYLYECVDVWLILFRPLMLDDGSPSPPASKFSHSHPAEAMHESFYIQSVSRTNTGDLNVQRVKMWKNYWVMFSDIQWSDCSTSHSQAFLQTAVISALLLWLVTLIFFEISWGRDLNVKGDFNCFFFVLKHTLILNHHLHVSIYIIFQ